MYRHLVAMFMQKEPGQLRGRLQQLDQKLKLRKISPELYQDRRIEVLTALQRLGEPLLLELLQPRAEDLLHLLGVAVELWPTVRSQQAIVEHACLRW